MGRWNNSLKLKQITLKEIGDKNPVFTEAVIFRLGAAGSAVKNRGRSLLAFGSKSFTALTQTRKHSISGKLCNFDPTAIAAYVMDKGFRVCYEVIFTGA